MKQRKIVKVPVVWKKQTLPISWARYKRNYEPCFFLENYDSCIFGGKGAAAGSDRKARWFGPSNESSVWEIDSDPNHKYVHPTQKPVALAERAIRNSSLPGEIVLDFFSGSGSTLIGCETTDRRCRMMEKSPYFCQIIVERWCGFSGIDEVKINGKAVSWSGYRERK